MTGRLRVLDDVIAHKVPDWRARDYVASNAWVLRASAADNYWYGIAWSPELGLFCAVAYSGTGNRVMTSPDGINWTTRASAADNVWSSVAWSPELGLFAAVAATGTGNRVMTSPDGITWTIRTSAADNDWNSVAWSPELGLFGAVAPTGAGNRVMTSPDGINWTLRTSAADNDWYAIAWSPELGLFAAVAGSGVGNRVMTSPDGITWTLRTSAVDNQWRSLAWSPELGLFAAVAATGTGNRVMTSVSTAPVHIDGDTMSGGLTTQALSASTGSFSDNVTVATGKLVDGRDISAMVRAKILIGTYTGNDADNRDIDIGVDLTAKSNVWIVVKSAGAYKAVQHKLNDADNSYFFDATATAVDRIQGLTTTGFQIGSYSDVNASGQTYIYIVTYEEP